LNNGGELRAESQVQLFKYFLVAFHDSASMNSF
jgi:hypothetical protein